MTIPHQGNHWVIVLAGGSGTRLSTLTRDGRGNTVPKQYCALRGNQSLLGDAMARASALATDEHIVVVVAREHERYWGPELAGHPAQRIVQPHNCGTAAGVLLPLTTILRRDPSAIVTLLPSDHFVADEHTLTGSLRAAQRAASTKPHRTILLGIEPDAAETDYGWILPVHRGGPFAPTDAADTTLPIAAFLEKPDLATAAVLWSRGAVWNSFLVVAKARALRSLYAARLPALLAAFDAAAPDCSPARAEALYERLPSNDFSRDLLEGAADQLGLRIVPPCGWTDLGTPDRVRACLATGAGPSRRPVGAQHAALSLAETVQHAGMPWAFEPSAPSHCKVVASFEPAAASAAVPTRRTT